MRVFGGVTTVFGLATILQSILVSFIYHVEGAGDMAGIVGIIVGALMVIGGLVAFSEGKDKNYHFRMSINILLIIVFCLSAILGFVFHGAFTDLIIWSTWAVFSLLITIFNMIFPTTKKIDRNENESNIK